MRMLTQFWLFFSRTALLLSWLPWLGGRPVWGLVMWALTGALMAWWARRWGRNPWGWGIVGGLFWSLGPLTLFLLGRRGEEGPLMRFAEKMLGRWFMRMLLGRR